MRSGRRGALLLVMGRYRNVFFVRETQQRVLVAIPTVLLLIVVRCYLALANRLKQKRGYQRLLL